MLNRKIAAVAAAVAMLGGCVEPHGPLPVGQPDARGNQVLQTVACTTASCSQGQAALLLQRVNGDVLSLQSVPITSDGMVFGLTAAEIAGLVTAGAADGLTHKH